MSLGSTLNAIGIVAEAVVVGLLLYRRVGRRLPLFLVYCISSLIIDCASLALSVFSHSGYGINFYLAESALDFALQFCVLVELAWSVLQPVRRFLSPRALMLIAALILAVGATIWPFAGLSSITAPSVTWHVMMQLQQTVSIVRVLFFLVLAASSQVLSLGWRDRELQVATGFGFYSLVSIGVAVINTHQSTADQFRNLYVFVVAGFLISLLYWIFCFAQKEPARRQFTPQIQHSLLALAESAHVMRKTLSDPDAREGKNKQDGGTASTAAKTL